MAGSAGGDGLAADASHLLPLLRELGDLKRIRSAGRDGSIATRLFRSAWGSLCAGHAPARVALAVAASALAATRLGDLDAAALAGLGLAPDEALAIQRAGLAELGSALPTSLQAALADALAEPECAGAAGGAPSAALPPFVRRLEEQPRAGVTCPGKPRIVLQPPESHAEHCLVVAVYGVLLAPRFGADPTIAFLAGLAHHLHNAAMPDAGFTGEVLLGPHLEPVMRRATEAALGELGPDLRSAVEAARAVLPDAGTPEGRAFHAADVLDRVLEIEQHLRGATLTMGTVLGEMELVHAGPVKPFHDRVLAGFGLC